MNAVKQICNELGITQKELAELLKVNEGTPAQWSSKGVPPWADVAMGLLIENKKLKDKLDKLKGFIELLDELKND